MIAYGAGMNKTQLVDAVSARVGDRRAAAAAVDGVLDTIVATVATGESVTIIGFGVFEGRARAARTARNPRTGAAVAVPATTVPAFRPGAGFRTAVGGERPQVPSAKPAGVRRSSATAFAADAPAVAPTPPGKAGKADKSEGAGQPAKAQKPGKGKPKKAKAKK